MSKTWKARIKLAKVGQQNVTVQADTQAKAKAMIEAQYGKGCIISGPNPQR
jgi:hypothetical protein